MSSFAKNLDEFFPLLDILAITGRLKNASRAWRGADKLPFFRLSVFKKIGYVGFFF